MAPIGVARRIAPCYFGRVAARRPARLDGMFVPRADEVVTNVYQVSLPGTSVFMLLDDEVTIVDSGWRGTGRSVLESLARLGRHRSEVSNIVVTHHHSDHLGDAAYLSERCSARVAVHRDEAPFVQGDVTPPSPFTNRVLGRLISPLVASRKPRPVAVDLTLEDGDVLDGMRVVHSPGHTPGSISIHLPRRGLLIVGDALEHRRGRLGFHPATSRPTWGRPSGRSESWLSWTSTCSASAIFRRSEAGRGQSCGDSVSRSISRGE